MQRSTFWRLALLAGTTGFLMGCEPPPLEVVTEQPDFTVGVTNPPNTRSAPPPVTEIDGPDTTISSQSLDENVVSENEFDIVSSNGTLTERLPNTCKLESYQQYVGQNAAVLATAGLDRAWRIQAPSTIVTQEYNPARLNFRTNGGGVVESVICG